MLDLAIIGGGPAALSAAIYAGRAGLKTTVFERASIGGELDQIHHISNYPGFEGSGQELAKILRRQVEQSGAKLSYGECTAITEVTSAEEDPEFQLTIDDETIKARAVLLATGSEPRPSSASR